MSTAARGPSRRIVLTGAAGLVVGGGVGAGAAELADRASRVRPTASQLPSPGEELMTEHGVLKRILLAYRAAAVQLTDPGTAPLAAITDAAQIVADYIESFHEGLEEAYVFPRVQAMQPDLVRTLLVQHDRGRHLTAAILTAAAAPVSATTRAALRTYLDQFVRMYEPHEAWEDTIVYPALRAATPPPTLELLAERFAELENRQYGDSALGKILGRVSGVEQQLGIADLASFTPPALAGD